MVTAMQSSGRVALWFVMTWGACGAGAQVSPLHAVWVGSWAASQQIPEPQNAAAAEDLTDATIRQIVHLSIGGSQVRVHLSNAFGTEPLRIDAIHVAHVLVGGKIDAATDMGLTFAGRPDVVIPAGAEYISDAVKLSVTPLSDLSVTLHMAEAPARETGHPGSRETSYFAHGSAVGAVELPEAKKIEHWYFLSGVDVPGAPGGFSVVTLGDSITDGHGATTNGNDRWPDDLAQRLQASGKMRNVGVLNQGIGGNHMLTDGLGPNVLARFDRDVLAQPGVRTVILLEGINDLGGLSRAGEATASQHDALVAQMIGSYEQVVERAHTHGIKVLGATITPDVGSDYYHPAPANEADRVKLNEWIRGAGHFDGVIDFDKTVADPTHTDRLRPEYDSGDHLHPSPAGYKAMAATIPLGLLE